MGVHAATHSVVAGHEYFQWPYRSSNSLREETGARFGEADSAPLLVAGVFSAPLGLDLVPRRRQRRDSGGGVEERAAHLLEGLDRVGEALDGGLRGAVRVGGSADAVGDGDHPGAVGGGAGGEVAVFVDRAGPDGGDRGDRGAGRGLHVRRPTGR